MDITMTVIRLDIFFFVRRIFNHVSQKTRETVVAFMLLSGAYLISCVVSRTVIFESSHRDDRRVRIGLNVGDLVLNVGVAIPIARVMGVLVAAERLHGRNRPVIVEASRPCAGMLVVATL
jgi:hypothetical protein